MSGFHAGLTVEMAPAPQQTPVVEIVESNPRTVKSAVEEYFADIPILVRVAHCESRFRHLNSKTGGVIRGEINPYDVGVMQINEKYHLETSQKLGYDIYSLDGNMAYARYLYKKEGARPWLSSSHCWAKTEIALNR